MYASSDHGENWERITDGLPATSINALAQHPTAHNLLFAGSEVGVHFSIDGGANWHPLGNGLPTVPVDDIVVHPRDNDLVIGTHGLGIWIMDDITPLERLGSEVMASSAHLFPVRRATSYNPYRPQGWTPGIYAAPNPQAGARIRYHLGSAMDSVAITIADGAGTVVRELKGGGAAGLNEVIWDLRLTEDGADGETMDPGPRVLPGSYRVALATAADTLETSAEVRFDPRVTISRGDLVARHDAMMDSYRLSGAVGDANDRIESMTGQLDAVEERVDDAEEAPEGLTEEIEAFREALDEVDEELGDVSGGASVWGTIQSSSSLPTADQLWQTDRTWDDLPAVIERVNELLTTRMPALLARVYAEAVRPEVGQAVVMPSRGR